MHTYATVQRDLGFRFEGSVFSKPKSSILFLARSLALRKAPPNSRTTGTDL